MKKFYFFAALVAGTALTSCTSEDDLALSPPETVAEEVNAPIVFSSLKNNITRGDITGKAAADSLGNQFVVFGYKGDETGNPGSTVFDNYLVKYIDNSANTTESNSSNWEYVLENVEGKLPIKHAVDHGITKQTIKYWDYSKTQYDFIAWSTGSKTAIYEGTPDPGEVLVSAIAATPATGEATGLATAYTFFGKVDDLKDCYIADLVTVNKSGDPGYGETTGYNKPVTLRFRQLGTKVRIGIYETVPGYSVREMKFYTKDGPLEAETEGDATTPGTPKSGQIVENATIFSAGADIYKEGTYTVFFPTVDKPDSVDNNQAHIKFTAAGTEGDKTTIVDWGTLNYTLRESGESSDQAIYLGRSSNTATYAGDPANNYYEFYLPNETGANLNLRVDFKLESIDGSGEIIEVKNAKAQVPSIYTTWKPGFAYTYLFKISDKTNGRTGVYDPTQADDATINSDPAGLYPITFDAVVVNAEEDATQETITLIATPSITTYQQKSTVVNADEYKDNGYDIFVTVDNNKIDNNLNLITLTGHAGLYSLREGMTEAEVIDALTYQDDDAAEHTIKGRSGKVLDSLTCVTDAYDLTEANTWMLTDTVKFGADGNAIKVGTDQALRFKPEAGKTYAFVYEETLKTKDSLMYQALAFDDFATGQTKYRYQYKNAQAGDVQKDSTYFDGDGNPKTVFLGQTVNNLYLDEAGTAATGYAKTNTAYYYTLDGGQSYIEAHNVDYDPTNSLDGLYVETTTPGTYASASAGQPADGIAYYYYDTTKQKYIYCVFLPEQADSLKVLDTTKYVVAEETTAIAGQTYFDMYKKNDAVRYVKVIKVAAE